MGPRQTQGVRSVSCGIQFLIIKLLKCDQIRPVVSSGGLHCEIRRALRLLARCCRGEAPEQSSVLHVTILLLHTVELDAPRHPTAWQDD
jgi:hypothetical protein